MERGLICLGCRIEHKHSMLVADFVRHPAGKAQKGAGKHFSKKHGDIYKDLRRGVKTRVVFTPL